MVDYSGYELNHRQWQVANMAIHRELWEQALGKHFHGREHFALA